MLYLDAGDLREALSMPEAIDAMRLAFGDEREVPPRTRLAGSLFMPGRVGEITGIKVVSTVSGNPVGLVVVFGEDGAPLGLVDGPTLTAIRTAAGAGLATDLLARGDARVMAMLGAGAMAADQVAAVRAVRPVEEVRIWSRSPQRAETIAVIIGASAFVEVEEAVAGADIITTATPSHSPLFPESAVGEDVHINAIGAFTPDMVELPGDLVRSCFVVVDDVEAASTEAGDLLQAGKAPDATVADVMAGRIASNAGRTLFKSVGIASQDVAAAVRALDRASEMGLGTPL